MRQRRKFKNRMISAILAVLMCGSLSAGVMPSEKIYAAESTTLNLETAKSMALYQSDDYTRLKNKLALAKVQYTQSVKSLKLKQKNQNTFRWSPLLNFKFPEKADLTDEAEYTYKPLELQSQIDVLNHSISDCVYGIYEKVELSFTKAYELQEKISFYEKRIQSYERTVSKNKKRLSAGLANQADVDAMESSLETLNSTLASAQRSFESEKETLSGLLGMDVSKYTLQNPLVEAELTRDIEDELIGYTLEHDDSLYQTQKDSANGLLSLNTNYDLMKKQYGDKMKTIDSFINQAKKGEKLDTAAFKLKYDELLEDVDSPWKGTKKILFIKIPKEWFKGAIDGIRYVEDEPYVLYESAMEYQSLYAEEQAQEKELTASVREYYDNYVSSRNSVESLKNQTAKKKKELQKAAAQNAAGQLSYEEYSQQQEEYEDLQMDLLTAQSSYAQILYSFDRLTCGALSKYFTGDSITMSAAEGGESYVVEEESGSVYYYIHSMVEGNLFEFGLSVPDNLNISITDYELWVDGVQIGERTSVSKVIRHLALDLDQVGETFVRLYDGDTILDDCTFDPAVYSDKLTIRDYHVETAENQTIGTYTAVLNRTTGMYEITISLNADQKAASYNIKTADGVYLISEAKRPVGEKFRYLAAIEGSIEELTISFYDESGTKLCDAGFRSLDQTLQKKGE